VDDAALGPLESNQGARSSGTRAFNPWMDGNCYHYTRPDAIHVHSRKVNKPGLFAKSRDGADTFVCAFNFEVRTACHWEPAEAGTGAGQHATDERSVSTHSQNPAGLFSSSWQPNLSRTHAFQTGTVHQLAASTSEQRCHSLRCQLNPASQARLYRYPWHSMPGHSQSEKSPTGHTKPKHLRHISSETRPTSASMTFKDAESDAIVRVL